MNDKFGFEEWAKRYDNDVKNDKSIFLKYNDVLDFVVEISNVKKGNLVLDIGTGTGNLLLKFLKNGAFVIGLDPSKNMLDEAKKKVKNYEKVEFILIEEPFLNIPFPDNYFDVVSSTYAFHHVSHELKEIALIEMLRVLKNKGILIIGDIMFKDKNEEEIFLEKYEFLDKDEFYERIDELEKILKNLNLNFKYRKFTDYTYVIWSVKI